MYYNFWTISFLILIGYTLCYCGKKELFENNENNLVQPKEKTGTKYTIVDVNKVVQAIIKFFGEKDNVNIQMVDIVFSHLFKVSVT